MKEVVITRPPYMNASEERIADMHSVLNILNLLVGELYFIEAKEPELAEAGKKMDAQLRGYAQEIKEGGDILNLFQQMRQSQDALVNHAKAALHAAETPAQKTQIQESIENLESIYSVLMRRLDEMEAHLEDPDAWIEMAPDALREEIENVFIAIAKNSKGGYGVQFNLAQKKKGDYYMDLRVAVEPNGSHGSHLRMPRRLLDVLRDLTANARKYTKPGGKVALAVYQNAEEIHAVIEDSGCGIPDHELDKITEFGYRASNVQSRPTMGGGFGLTKAAWLVANWGGQLAISSVVDEGTTVRITIPNRK